MENPIKPKVINDISLFELFHKKHEKIYSIGNKSVDKYFQVKEDSKDSVLTALTYFDGTHTLAEIDNLLRDKEQISINVNKFYSLLENTGLLENQTKDSIEKSEYQRLSLKLIEIDISKYKKVFSKLSVLVPFVFVSTLILSPLAVINILSNIYSFINLNNFSIYGSYSLGIICIIAMSLLSIGLHELAHGAVGRRFGLVPKSFTVSLYLLVSPIIYLKIPGIYTIDENKRIKLWGAGIYMNLFLSLISFSTINYLHGEVFKLVFIFGYINLISIVMNLWPFLPLDGYFILSTLMKIPNLRKNSFKEFKNFIKKGTHNLTAIYFIYFSISIIFMSAIVLSQIIMILRIFIANYNRHNSLLDTLWDLRLYLMLIFIAIVSKLRKLANFINLSK